MSKPAPQFMFDVGSPNAYLSHEAIPAIEAAHRRQIRICADPARRHLQGHQQQVARRNAGRRQEQARTSRRRDRTVRETLRRKALCLESVLSGQHAESDARRGRSANGRRVRKIRRRRVSSHVGRAEEDGRSRSGDEGIHGVRPRCGKTVRALAGSRRESKADRKHASPPWSAARSARRPSLSARKCSSARSSCARSRRWWRGANPVIASEAQQRVSNHEAQTGSLRDAARSLLSNDVQHSGSPQCKNATQPSR